MPDTFDQALRTVRSMLDLNYDLETILALPIIPPEYRERLRAEAAKDGAVILVPARTISRESSSTDWLSGLDRSNWYYWPTLRQFLLVRKGLRGSVIRSLDDSSDRVLRQLSSPTSESFDIRGLVLGFVQSGKTANFTALAAKAADAGYRLVVVLSGVDNGLRRQTNARLKKELVGYPSARSDSVPFPPIGKQWHEFTLPEFEGDFRPGFATAAALQGSQPVLLVVKKNAAVLRRLIAWLSLAPTSTRQGLPALIIDDEADQASIDTRGNAALEDEGVEYEPPAVINGLIRELLNLFNRKAYVAYTATPFANILVPHDVEDPRVGNDLYPKDFIIDLPAPQDYFGAEKLFGRLDPETGETIGGLDVIRTVEDAEIEALEEGFLPESLSKAMMDFALAGAARAERGDQDAPAAMLVHTSSRIDDHTKLTNLVQTQFAEIRDAWRYQRNSGIRERLRERWLSEQSVVTRRTNTERERIFEAIEPFIGPFLESVDVRAVNSATGEVLDYDREPQLKAIIVGGNRLSRGLTIEGLLVSYFVRSSATYDTLMQMGRWFGYRAGYEDLTRIWTTKELAQWFADLALVEHRLREDISMYEDQGLTPAQVSVRIWRHPTMQVTSSLKQRFASTTTIQQSFDLSLEQTFKFPFSSPETLAELADANLRAVRDFTAELGKCRSDEEGSIWREVLAETVLQFLLAYEQDDAVRSFSTPLMIRYIEECLSDGELAEWSVAIRGRKTLDATLGVAEWGKAAGVVRQISRSRLKGTVSLGVITGQGDEAIGLSDDEIKHARGLVEAAEEKGKKKAFNTAAREVRSPKHGLILLYPISRYSRPTTSESKNRVPIFDDPTSRHARDLVGVGISFPRSSKEREVEAYSTGTVGWRPTWE